MRRVIQRNRRNWAGLPRRRRLTLLGMLSAFAASWAVMTFGTGCSAILKQGPSDLRLVSLDLADESAATGEKRLGSSDRLVLVATLATDRDIGEIIFRNGAFPWIDAHICGRDPSTSEIVMFGPYYQGLDIGSFMTEVEKSHYASLVAAKPKGQPFFYKLWFDYEWNSLAGNSASSRRFEHDLQRDPQDICLTILGHPYAGIGVGLSTNGVVIPKSAIVEALRDLPP
jgi:hypothetical protein